jgi:hypothetical protein
VCGAELRPPLWKILSGFEVDTCDDPVACVTRFRVAGGTLFDAGWRRGRREVTQGAGPSAAAT